MWTGSSEAVLLVLLWSPRSGGAATGRFPIVSQYNRGYGGLTLWENPVAVPPLHALQCKQSIFSTYADKSSGLNPFGIHCPWKLLPDSPCIIPFKPKIRSSSLLFLEGVFGHFEQLFSALLLQYENENVRYNLGDLLQATFQARQLSISLPALSNGVWMERSSIHWQCRYTCMELGQ